MVILKRIFKKLIWFIYCITVPKTIQKHTRVLIFRTVVISDEI